MWRVQVNSPLRVIAVVLIDLEYEEDRPESHPSGDVNQSESNDAQMIGIQIGGATKEERAFE